MDKHISQEALDELLACRAPGWSGVVKEVDGLPVLELSHRYSVGHHLVGREGETFDMARCPSLLDNPRLREQFELLSDAPDGPSAKTISGLLQAVDICEWTPKEIGIVVCLLADSGGITDEEYNWLSKRVVRRSPA